MEGTPSRSLRSRRRSESVGPPSTAVTLLCSSPTKACATPRVLCMRSTMQSAALCASATLSAGVGYFYFRTQGRPSHGTSYMSSSRLGGSVFKSAPHGTSESLNSVTRDSCIIKRQIQSTTSSKPAATSPHVVAVYGMKKVMAKPDTAPHPPWSQHTQLYVPSYCCASIFSLRGNRPVCLGPR